MTSSSQIKYTLATPLAPEVPVRMPAPKQQTYTDPSIFARELSNIFDHEWVMVGRAGSIPNPGDYFTAFLGQRPIIIIRQRGLLLPTSLRPATSRQRIYEMYCVPLPLLGLRPRWRPDECDR